MRKEDFFQKRSPVRMRDELRMRNTYSQKGLVDRIDSLDDNQGLVIRSLMTPIGALKYFNNSAAVGRNIYRHGKMIKITEPATQQDAFQSFKFQHTPFIARLAAIEKALKDLREEEINFIGLTWQPVQSNDLRWRVVPFDVPVEGTKIYCYAVHHAGGIPVDDRYVNAKIVSTEGAKLQCAVPSRTEKQGRYMVNLVNVALENNQAANAIILGLKSQYEKGDEPGRNVYLHNLRYERFQGGKSSDVFTFGPHDVAAYIAVMRKYWQKSIENTVPLVYNPFALPSKWFAEFKEKLDNQVLIYDPTIQAKDGLRNLHLDEVCKLLVRAIKVKGAFETVFWDPKRDGNLKDYWK